MPELLIALAVLVLAGGVVGSFAEKTPSSFSLKKWRTQMRDARKSANVLSDIRHDAQFFADPTRHEEDLGVAGLSELAEPGEGYLDPQILLDNLTTIRKGS